MYQIIYRGYPVRNPNRTLYVGRTCQNLTHYVNKRNQECFTSNPSSRRKLFMFMRKAYRTKRSADTNIIWEVVEKIRNDKTSKQIQKREQYWIDRLEPAYNGRNEIAKLF